MDMISHYSAGIPYVVSRTTGQSGTNPTEITYASADEYRNMIEELESKKAIDPSATLYNGSTTRAKLSDTEIAVLANKYDVHNMSDREFDNFLDDLESMGAISNFEKRRLGYKGMEYLDLGDAKSGVLMMSAWVAPAIPGGSKLLFNRLEANGDISRWINERIQWEPGYSKDSVQRRAQEDEVSLYKTLSNVINRMDSQQERSANEAAKKELVRQLADKNSEFYVNMRTQLKQKVDENEDDKEKQAIIDALGKVLDALSGKEEAPGKKESVNQSASELTEKIGRRISKLNPEDPEKTQLEQMLQRLQEIGIYFDLNDMDDLWQGEDEAFETLTQFLTRLEAKKSETTHPDEQEVNETA